MAKAKIRDFNDDVTGRKTEKKKDLFALVREKVGASIPGGGVHPLGVHRHRADGADTFHTFGTFGTFQGTWTRRCS